MLFIFNIYFLWGNTEPHAMQRLSFAELIIVQQSHTTVVSTVAGDVVSSFPLLSLFPPILIVLNTVIILKTKDKLWLVKEVVSDTE